MRLVLLSGSYGCAYSPAHAVGSPSRSAVATPDGRTPARPTAWERSREAAGRQLRGHGADALAVGLVVIGVLTVLGLASDLAGSVGSFLAGGSATMLGRGRIVFPAACFGFAVLLFAGYRPRGLDADEDDEPEDDETRAPAPLRIGLGIVLVMLAVVGLLHLAGGSPPVDPTDGLRNAGGLLGAAVASPLAAGAGVVGTAVILTGLGLLGLLLAPGVPMRRVFDTIAAGARWAAAAVSELFQLRGHDASAAALGGPQPAAAVEAADELEEDDLELDDVPEPEVYDPVAETDREPPARTTVEPGGQVAIDLGPGYRAGTWKLPPANVLKRGTKHEMPTGASSRRAARSSRRRWPSSASTPAHRHDRRARRSRGTSSSSARA